MVVVSQSANQHTPFAITLNLIIVNEPVLHLQTRSGNKQQDGRRQRGLRPATLVMSIEFRTSPMRNQEGYTGRGQARGMSRRLGTPFGAGVPLPIVGEHGGNKETSPACCLAPACLATAP